MDMFPTEKAATAWFESVIWPDGRHCPKCARPVAGRITKTALWLSTVLVAAAAAFPYVAPLLLDA